MTSKRLTIQMSGSVGENGDVRLEDFLQQLHSVQYALVEVNKLISQECPIFYTIDGQGGKIKINPSYL